MKAQTLAISVPNLGCNKNCPYCISKMTGYMKHNFDIMMHNLPKVKRYAELAQVSNVIFTSKGEIFNSVESSNMMHSLMETLKDFPIEVQTNGEIFLDDVDPMYRLRGLYEQGVNVVAISIDNVTDIKKYQKVISSMKDELIFRATINLTSILGSFKQPVFCELIEMLKQSGFKQVSFREITVPNFGMVDTLEANKTFEWISKHTISDPYVNQIKAELDYVIKNYARLIRTLPYGAKLYDYEDVAITYFDYCIQDSANEDDIRSLIFQEDGHLYTSWNSKASIIF